MSSSLAVSPRLVVGKVMGMGLVLCVGASALAAGSAARVVDVQQKGAAPTGPYSVVVEHDPSLATHTIYRPEPLGKIQHPILVWGEGACAKTGLMFPEYLSEIASHGIVVVADGPPVPYNRERPRPAADGQAPTSPAPRPRIAPDGKALIQALDWAVDQNGLSGGTYHQKLDTTKVAAMGMSCGGLMAYGASGDPRIGTIGIWNSGLLERNPAIFAALHGPVLLITGGPDDIAYKNALTDFETMPAGVPLFYAVYPSVGHYGTYSEDNGGAFGAVAVAWLKWQLLGDQGEKAKGLFAGPDFALGKDATWIVKKKGMP